ncbi:MAG: bifunctional UDP-3-O-[3-hydroxymyristoyl] N-acetylglucosamine deacetylase/3-hydroxyacyl-ACP dehydratase [Puniceicoccales bacterium]|jgi:UDP-3-O-[3-hydroxymyristoyl] N-acetylglucosamine deacetylase/3-hydroxyacyl-[acyl-carrier-protein] dehydratase|nr:bifunctional UDP-3-O-[3-hydroxymyristoyl] N-acetylglucosamine deacetylase/3-hydroxyacyl-ACP dehydratase [Puniceicoccales bacterium]
MVKQRTILREVAVRGRAVHTGQEVLLRLRPAEEGAGICFHRVDLPGKPELRPDIGNVGDLVRCTTLAAGDVRIHTVEHLLAALHGLGVDNVHVDIDGCEPPILDGSAREFANLLQQAEIVEQAAERNYFILQRPVSVVEGNRSLLAVPYDGLKITCTFADDRGNYAQHLSIDIFPDTFLGHIAPARTFTFYEDIEPLLNRGKLQGGSLESAIVIKGDQLLSKEPLRFSDEFVRHKILDILGDLTLLGLPLKAHVIAIRPGHSLNAKLVRAIRQSEERAGQNLPLIMASERTESVLNVRQIANLLPHRYPFFLVDKVLTVDDERLVAIKNVTINEPFFQGHFPGRPILPGVLQLEAMAQAAGVLMLRQAEGAGKLAFLMSCDRVKFRRVVEPGDQLRIEIQLLKSRGRRIAVAEGVCKVDGQVVSSATLMFTLVDDAIE